LNLLIIDEVPEIHLPVEDIGDFHMRVVLVAVTATYTKVLPPVLVEIQLPMVNELSVVVVIDQADWIKTESRGFRQT
jgi:hypothetical protein